MVRGEMRGAAAILFACTRTWLWKFSHWSKKKNENATLCCFATQHSANVFLLVAFSPHSSLCVFFAAFAFARACCVFVFISLENGAFTLSLSIPPSLSLRTQFRHPHIHPHCSLPLHLALFLPSMCLLHCAQKYIRTRTHTHTNRTFGVSHGGGMFLCSPSDNIVCRYIFINILLFCSSNLTMCASAMECHPMECMHIYVWCVYLEFRTVKCRRQ